MDPCSLLDKIVGEAKPKPTAKPSGPKRPVINDGAKHEPFNQCPHCLVVNAYCIVLPAGEHVRMPDGTITVVFKGEGYYECKYCHIVDHMKGKGRSHD